MKAQPISLLVAGALALAGCSKHEHAAPPAAAAAVAPAATAPGPKAFAFTASDAMKFNFTRIEAFAGDEVTITLTNIGTLPKQAMGHNWVLLAAGVDPQEVANAAVMAAANDYFPAQFADQVIAHTKMLGAKQRDRITFKAPAQPGEYVFLCTFPAHYAAGMKGILVVR